MDEKLFSNHVRRPDEIDRTKPLFDASDDSEAGLAIYLFIRGNRNLDPPCAAFQCVCGNLGLVPLDPALSAKIPRDESGGIRCPSCGDYQINYKSPLPGTDFVRAGIDDFVAMLGRAKEDNYFTLCYYLWESLNAFAPRLNEIRRLVDRMYQLHMRNVLAIAMWYDGIGHFRLDVPQLREEDIMLQMMLVNHVIEATELYDVVITLAQIARSDLFLIGDDGLTIHYGVGKQIVFDENERDRLAARLKLMRMEILKTNSIKFAGLLKRIFNTDLRNAFAHSEYRITGDGIYLTKYDRIISEEVLADAVSGAYFVLQTIFDFIEHERRSFIEVGGYKEGGWTLTPTVEDARFSITVSGNAPGPSITGKVRRAAWKEKYGVDPI